MADDGSSRERRNAAGDATGISVPCRPRSDREFGLDRPALSAVLLNDDQRLLAVHFGSTNPQKVLQYMRIDGRDEVYVMSRFVGAEWEQALAEVEP